MAGRLFVFHKTALAESDAARKKVAKQLAAITWLIVACGFGLIIWGAAVPSVRDNYIGVGFTLLATGIVFLVQSEWLKQKEDKAKNFLKQIQLGARVVLGVAFIGLLAIIVEVVVIILRAK